MWRMARQRILAGAGGRGRDWRSLSLAARQICRATGPTICGFAAGALRADGTQDGQPQGRVKRRRYANKGTKSTKGARQVCRATGPTICGCAAGALRAVESRIDNHKAERSEGAMPTRAQRAKRVRGKYAAPQDRRIAAAPLAAEDGGYQNGQRRNTKGRAARVNGELRRENE